MKTNIIDQKHYLWKVIPEVNAICEPLFRKAGITYFNYARAYNDGSIAGLFSHPEWLLYSLVHGVSPSGIELRGFERFSLLGSEILPSSPMDLKKYKKCVDAFKNLLGFDYMLCINYQEPDYYEAFAFASTVGNSGIVNFYLNNLEYLDKFTHFFRDKASLLIENASKPENKILRIKDRPEEFEGLIVPPDKSFKAPPKNILPDNYPLILSKTGTPLSTRELDCMAFIANGRTAKEIGKLMKISNRTVEAHIYNIKNKLDCNRKSEIVDIALENRLNQIIKTH